MTKQVSACLCSWHNSTMTVERLWGSPFTSKLPKDVQKESTDMAGFFSELAQGYGQSAKNALLAV